MIRIRLKRIGKKRHPHYRVVVADKPDKRDGRFIENLGSYDPHADPPTIVIDGELAKAWIAKGAQPSESAEKILVRAGVLEKKPAVVKAKLELKRAEQTKAAEARAKTRTADAEKAAKAEAAAAAKAEKAATAVAEAPAEDAPAGEAAAEEAPAEETAPEETAAEE